MLIVVRHGRTEANAAGLLVGRRLDPRLDELGRRQAAALPASRRRPAASSAARCSAPGRRPPPSGCRSRSTSAGSRSTTATSTARRCATCPPDVWAAWRADPGFAPGGGESLRRRSATRVRRACDDLVEEARASATSSSSPTCPRSRPRWPGPSAWATRCRGGPSWPPASMTRIATAARAPRCTPSTAAPTSTGFT